MIKRCDSENLIVPVVLEHQRAATVHGVGLTGCGTRTNKITALVIVCVALRVGKVSEPSRLDCHEGKQCGKFPLTKGLLRLLETRGLAEFAAESWEASGGHQEIFEFIPGQAIWEDEIPNISVHHLQDKFDIVPLVQSGS